MTDKEVMQRLIDALDKNDNYEQAMALADIRTALAQPETYPENFIDALTFEAALAQPEDDGSCGDPDCDVCL